MATLQDLLDRLWEDYQAITPQAQRIHRLLTQRGETLVNDHIALRTYDDPRINLDVLAKPFVRWGYRAAGEYTFPEKKLRAQHFECADPCQPKVFISELKLGECSGKLQQRVTALIDQIDRATLQREDLPAIGRPWRIAYADYQALAQESEYAGWVAAFGFRANHFTVFVNALETFDSLEALNAFLTRHGFKLNTVGGVIKGSPEVYLEQSSTCADEIDVEFSDGVYKVPSCYYEFARRYPLPDGRLFQGFVAQSADKIFHSTDRRA